MRPEVSLREALSDPQLLGNVLAGPSWQAWRVLLISSMGEALTEDERVIFKQLTGRDHEPNIRVEDFIGVIGRRGGKSRAIATLCTYLAGLVKYPMLVAGEVGVLLCVATDIEAASIVFSYLVANFEQSPILRQLIAGQTNDTLRLTNGIEVQIRSASFRRLRGPSYVACIIDEAAFLLTSETSSNPDAEIVAAVRPGLATTNGPLFLISSPYARRGVLWDLYNRHYGVAGDRLILVAQAASRVMNPSLPQSVVDRAIERDAASAAAEYGACFRTDLEAFVSLDAVTACVARGVYERAYQQGVTYHAFADPSGGSADSFTLCIAHNATSTGTILIDLLREVNPPFSAEQVVLEFSNLIKSYKINKVVSDRYAGIWPAEMFAKVGILFEQSAASRSPICIWTCCRW